MSILSGIYVKAYDDKITLMATDLKTSIKCTVHDAVIEEEGESIFPTKGVGEIIKKLSLDFLIEATNERITIKHERDKFSLLLIRQKTSRNYLHLLQQHLSVASMHRSCLE